MAILRKTYLIFSMAPLAFFFGCVEPFEARTVAFEDAIIIDALLTDELKRQEVLLSRAYRFEEAGANVESKAEVQILDDTGKSYVFLESEPGVYLSANAFAAESGRSYELKVKTANGRSYRSSTVTTPRSVPIVDIKAERRNNDLGKEGVSILLDNRTTEAEPTYFRFEYEETYKIIAPKWDPFEFEVVHYIACDTIPYEVGIKPWQEERKVCYGSANSARLIQTATLDLSDNQVDGFEIRFIDSSNYIMSHRYSINVRQYSQTPDAYSFYQRLDDFSSSDNIFSQIQPGFFQGNVFSETNEDEKVLGFFEVASVSTRRVYFNYADLFPGEPLPPYAVNCETPGNPLLYSRGHHCADFRVCDGACESPLIEAILAGIVVYRSTNENPSAEAPGPYFTWPSPCGDCTKLGSNIVPDFWEE